VETRVSCVLRQFWLFGIVLFTRVVGRTYNINVPDLTKYLNEPVFICIRIGTRSNLKIWQQWEAGQLLASTHKFLLQFVPVSTVTNKCSGMDQWANLSALYTMNFIGILDNSSMRQSRYTLTWWQRVENGFWFDKENQHKRLNYFAQQLGIKTLDSWYGVRVGDLRKFGGWSTTVHLGFSYSF
jgi:hypothetical protein